MELFNEIYGKYYLIFFHLLREASNGPITVETIRQIIGEYGYQESLLHLLPKVLPGEDSYPLLVTAHEKNPRNGVNQPIKYESIIKNKPEPIATIPELRWLKTVLSDPRVVLFLIDESKAELLNQLDSYEPLFDLKDYQLQGVSNDGDDFGDLKYQNNFRKIMEAFLQKRLIKLNFSNAEGEKRFNYYAPYRLEYSIKDDKFRLTAGVVHRGKLIQYHRINLARIQRVTLVEDGIIPENLEEFVRAHRCETPIEIEMLNLRNGFERCFIQLSGYERSTEYDEETKRCKMKLYYYDFEEPELLITLLSFGPTIKVLGPKKIRDEIIERIKRQLDRGHV